MAVAVIKVYTHISEYLLSHICTHKMRQPKGTYYWVMTKTLTVDITLN